MSCCLKVADNSNKTSLLSDINTAVFRTDPNFPILFSCWMHKHIKDGKIDEGRKNAPVKDKGTSSNQ